MPDHGFVASDVMISFVVSKVPYLLYLMLEVYVSVSSVEFHSVFDIVGQLEAHVFALLTHRFHPTYSHPHPRPAYMILIVASSFFSSRPQPVPSLL
jgi:hypothetical protein